MIILLSCRLAEFECYPHLAPSLPLAMDNKALTHFLSVTAFSTVAQCALSIISHISLWHSKVPKKKIKASWSQDEEVVFLQYLVEHQSEVTWGCFKAATLTAAINLISHLHVKGPVKTKSNAANKWNRVSFDYLRLSTDYLLILSTVEGCEPSHWRVQILGLQCDLGRN